jgi:hypothetical protein
MRRQYEAHIADLKEASELRHKETLRTIKALADEVEYLRSQLFGARNVQVQPARVPVMPEQFDFMPTANPHYLSEEEEELAALRAGGHIDQIEHDAALAQVRAAMGLQVPITIES